MNWIKVSSARIKAIAWEPNHMYIEFHDGAQYCYENVSETEYLLFFNAPSLGHELVSFQKAHLFHKL